MARQRVLVVDDEPQVLVALEDLLSERFSVLKTASAEDALDVMSHEHDIAVVITDQRMPKMKGDELLSRLGSSSAAQRILLTGFADLSAVIRAVNEGKIFAYVTKPWNPEDLQLKVQTAADHFRLAKELENERKRLQKQTRILNSILDSMREGVIAVDREREVLLFNRRAQQILGAAPGGKLPPDWAEAYGVYLPDGKSPLPRAEDPLARAMSGEAGPDEAELFVNNRVVKGATITVSATGLFDQENRLAGGIALLRDVTQQKNLERQLVQAQKMEAIGRLAGGVAHDFNNLLAVIHSYGELALNEIEPQSPVRDDLSQLLAAAHRATALTRQLLSFSRRQVVQVKAVQLNEIVTDIEKMLRRIIGEDIDLEGRLSPALGAVRADPGQIEQIIVNLTVNARDAMPKGGKLTIETANVALGADYAASHADVTAGQYVMLAVSDNGTGMSSEVQARVFEPFFTTKPVGEGTGLGLSTVYGIVRQSGGHIGVYSELLRGTTFKVYLPRVDAVPSVPVRRSEAPLVARATGTILLVEDDEAVRRVATRILRDCGYTVLEARRAADARRFCAAHGTEIDLMLTDVVMPEISGPALAAELTGGFPQLRVLFMSGYPGGAVVHEGLVDGGAMYIEKPFTPVSLAAKVREALSDD